MFVFFLFCLLFLFSFCLLFKIPFVSLLFVHQPLFGRDSLWGVLLSFLFVFSFLNVFFFLWNKLPSIPFLKPKLLLPFAFFLLLFWFLFSWCMFLPFCFDVGFVFVMCLFCFEFVFALFLVLLSDCEKNIAFPAILVFLSCGFLSRIFFSITCFCSCLFFLCCLFPV